MPLELQPAAEADARRSAEIEAAAYAPNPFNRILFPGPLPPDALDGRASQLVAELKKDQTTRWLKVVDTDLPEAEQMIAFAKFHICLEKPQITPRTFGPGCNAEACELLFGGIVEQRARIMEDRSYVYLSILYTDPKHQGRGAGGMLVRRVIEEAQKLGLIVYLAASPPGHELYKKCGFRDVECLSLDMSKWGAKENLINWAMIWEPPETV
ncbi:acyl-CoA N-acyltransferase [Hypoxylon sp. FL0890]|nr:acyl-CoA N-acyltransferase [Hypoxylon sp. FL0890]